MSCFLLPQEITKKLTSSIARLWWSTKENNRGIHWIAWDKICLPLDIGGLGFRDFCDMNLALLGKQLWRILKFPNSLIAKTFKRRYYRHSNPLTVKKANNQSYGWRSIMDSAPIIKNGLRWTIGNGEDRSVWTDLWIPACTPRPATRLTPIGSHENTMDMDLKVHHLIDFYMKEWKQDLIREIIAAEDIPLILSLKPSRFNRSDSYSWNGTSSGHYTVRAGYYEANKQRKASASPLDYALVTEPSTTALRKEVWKIKAPRKIKNFLRQSFFGALPSASNLKKRNCSPDMVCQRCGAEEESTNHLLFECPPSLQCWALSSIPTRPGTFPCSSLYANMDHLLWRAKEAGTQVEDVEIFPWLLWYIWKARNAKIFEGENVKPLDTLNIAIREAQIWKIAQEMPTTDIQEVEDTRQAQQELRTNRSNPSWRCQVDASWVGEDQIAGLGFVLLNDDNIIMTGAKGCDRIATPLHAELEGLRWEMETIITRGFTSLCFQSDCAQLVRVIENQEDWPSIEPELDDFLYLRSKFISFDFVFVQRSMNSRADGLAKGAGLRANLSAIVVPDDQAWLASNADHSAFI